MTESVVVCADRFHRCSCELAAGHEAVTHECKCGGSWEWVAEHVDECDETAVKILSYPQPDRIQPVVNGDGCACERRRGSAGLGFSVRRGGIRYPRFETPYTGPGWLTGATGEGST